MKIPDYLHSKLLHYKNNDKVFQKTYDTIHKLTTALTETEVTAYDITDKKQIENLMASNADYICEMIIPLVNFTIEKFKK